MEMALQLQPGDSDHAAGFSGHEAEQIVQSDVLLFHGVAEGGEFAPLFGELADLFLECPGLRKQSGTTLTPGYESPAHGHGVGDADTVEQSPSGTAW